MTLPYDKFFNFLQPMENFDENIDKRTKRGSEMKKKQLIILLLCLILAAFALWQGGQGNVPSQEEVISCLTEKGEDEAKKLLLGYSHEEIGTAWGSPDDTLSGFWGEIWKTDNAISITVYFDQDGCVTNVLFRSQAK